MLGHDGQSEASESPWLNVSHTLIGFADNLSE
jgi:hypothetical protein